MSQPEERVKLLSSLLGQSHMSLSLLWGALLLREAHRGEVHCLRTSNFGKCLYKPASSILKALGEFLQ